MSLDRDECDGVPLEEALERMRRPLTEEEREETRAIVAWFTRRYPTLPERFAYVRKRHAEWTRTRIGAVRDSASESGSGSESDS